MKLAIIGLMAGVIILGGAYAYDQGMFDSLTEFSESMGTLGDGLSGLPSPTQGFVTTGAPDYSDAAIQAKYSPEELKMAVQSGEVDYNKLSSNTKDMLDNVELPNEVTP